MQKLNHYLLESGFGLEEIELISSKFKEQKFKNLLKNLNHLSF
jgi:hypothetical protein